MTSLIRSSIYSVTIMLGSVIGLSSASTVSTNSLNKDDLDQLVLNSFERDKDIYPCTDSSSINVRHSGDSHYGVYCGDEPLDFSCRIEKSVFPEYQLWYFILSKTPRYVFEGSCSNVRYGQK